ncbi:LOW QUALITY PROTEIN: uncharacterized protein LOC135199706 [Macrobrachium nipponense]|uniref:LOW QUALITY PROTEIN: uncharacterized protein LOC135199706 n=1 Tax=Macrobrachium nipponense TaxID=159736 RepID=UPI0030C8A37C
MFRHLLILASLADLWKPALGFLPTKLNYSDPDVIDLFCPKDMSGETWDHKAITREGIRREIRRFFLDLPPPTNDTFSIPEDATLSQIFRYYYGPTASPARFIKAVNSITWANAMTEASGQIRFNAAHHMDGEKISEGHTLLQGRYQQLISTIVADDAYPFARELLGTSLNTIQDFYSQTTWVELGYTDILKELGFPGQDIPAVAAPGESTCTECSDPKGECKDNVIARAKLSSGYYEYNVPGSAAFVVPKPTDAGKCSHGGTMDNSASKAPVGGINKETASPCFSPHHDLHKTAVDLAISATEYYLSVLREAIGNDYFRHLFDLYPGSALSIMIDTTGSMTQEIKAVKAESKLIVERTHPAFYVLTPYKDPDLGPVTATSEADIFLADLNKLDAYGGCCCTEENFWAALELALANTPDYSSVFCFTDAGGNDKQLMEGSIALATAKHCQVTVIYSFDQTKKVSQEPSKDISCPEDKYILSGVDEYKRLAAETGGLFIEIDKFDIDEIIGILEDVVEESTVAIRMRDEVTGSQKINFPVDDSVNYFQVVIAGEIMSSTLTDGDLTFDLMDKASLEERDGVEVVSHSTSLKSIKFANMTIGMWDLEVNGAAAEFSASISALSSLGLLTEFTDLDLRPSRPGYNKVIRGRPLIGEIYYVEITLVGYVDSAVKKVTSMELVDEQGKLLSHVDYLGEVDDHFFIRSEELPSKPFYIQVDGFLETGTPFSRICPTMVVPVRCSVELLLENSTLAAKAGETAGRSYFRATNYGPAAEFSFYARDQQLYITQWTPRKSTLGDSGGYADIAVTFRVPSNAVPGTVSTVTVTASSVVDVDNVNSAITYFSVLPEETDYESPICTTNDEPDCTGFDTEAVCESRNWTVTAILQDTKSGLSRISSTPSEILTVDEFSEGTKDPVTATLLNTCCVTEAVILGVDGQGNVGRCEWNISSAGGGAVLHFVVVSVGETWAYLEWTVSDVREDLSKYTIIVNDDFSTDSRCHEKTCYYNMTYLDPCTRYQFQLNPYFVSGRGPNYFAQATTLPSGVSPPVNPTTNYTTQTSMTISWEATMDNACLLGYKICYRRYDSLREHCSNPPPMQRVLLLKHLEACTMYMITIRTLTINGLVSEPLKYTTLTDEAAPGRPVNLHLVSQSGRFSEIAWDDPLEHPSCVNKWIVTHKPLNLSAAWRSLTNSAETNTTYFTFDDLLGCNLYEYTVSAVSPSDLPGGSAMIYDETEETSPREVQSLDTKALSPTSIDANWSPALVPSLLPPLRSLLDQHTFGTTSPPTGLGAKKVDPHSAVIIYGPPLENPQCVHEYDIRHVNLDEIFVAGGYSICNCKENPPGIFIIISSYPLFTPAGPREVQSLDTKALSPTSIDANWSPALVLACFHHYEVCLINTHSAAIDCFDTMDTQRTFKDLDPCVRYQISVTAASPSGFLSDKKDTFATTKDVATSPPTGLGAKKVDPHSAVIIYGPPLENPQCVHEYDIRHVNLDEMFVAGGATSKQAAPSAGNAEEVITGLDACTNYGVYMSVVTISGYVSGEVGTNFTTSVAIPSAPQELQVEGTTERSISLLWFAPRTNKACTTSYYLTWTSADDEGALTLDEPTKPFEIKKTIDGLQPCTKYFLTLSAVTTSGEHSEPARLDASTSC